MKNSSIENELVGSLRYLDTNQKSDVLSFVKQKLNAQHRLIVKNEALRDIRLALKSNMAF